jgi:hypothetical protein
MRKIYFLFILVPYFVLFSCKEVSNQDLKPNVTGKAGELLLVVDDNKWNSQVGDSLRAVFQAEVQILPQREPLFTVVNIPNKAFSNLFETHRSIVRVKISPKQKKASVLLRRDVWAKPQTVFEITAPNDSVFLRLFSKNKNAIVDTLLKDERARYLQSFIKFENQEVSRVLKERGVAMHIPKGYTLDVNKDDFMWISHETPMISQGILIGFIDYKDTAQLEKSNLIYQIDSLLKKNVPGALKGSYMQIEKRAEVLYKKMLRKGVYTIELRGLWQSEGDFMGGPFVALVSVDTKLNRIVLTFGYVYAPKYDKRNYMRQVETILYSLKINK